MFKIYFLTSDILEELMDNSTELFEFELSDKSFTLYIFDEKVGLLN